MTLVKAQVDASVAVLNRYGIGGNNLEEIVNAIHDAIQGAAPDNTLPQPPPVAGTPLPTPPTFPDAGLPTPPVTPGTPLPVPPPVPGAGLPPVNPNPNPDPDFDVNVPNRPGNELPETPSTKPSEPTGKPGHELPEHAEPKGKHK